MSAIVIKCLQDAGLLAAARRRLNILDPSYEFLIGNYNYRARILLHACSSEHMAIVCQFAGVSHSAFKRKIAQITKLEEA